MLQLTYLELVLNLIIDHIVMFSGYGLNMFTCLALVRLLSRSFGFLVFLLCYKHLVCLCFVELVSW